MFFAFFSLFLKRKKNNCVKGQDVLTAVLACKTFNVVQVELVEQVHPVLLLSGSQNIGAGSAIRQIKKRLNLSGQLARSLIRWPTNNPLFFLNAILINDISELSNFSFSRNTTDGIDKGTWSLSSETVHRTPGECFGGETVKVRIESLDDDVILNNVLLEPKVVSAETTVKPFSKKSSKCGISRAPYSLATIVSSHIFFAIIFTTFPLSASNL